MNIAAVDLNLLVVLHALLVDRSVTRAARRVGLSQPAASHALARLRDLLGDPLLVRAGRALVPTPRAQALVTRVEAAIAACGAVLEPTEPFDPKSAKRTFSLATSDYAQFLLLPSLLGRLGKLAPGVNLWVKEVGGRQLEDAVRDGDVDLFIAPPLARWTETLHSTHLFTERFVCIVRQRHPRVRSKLTLSAYLELPHAFIAPSGAPGGPVDDALKRLGKERRVALAVPQFLIAPHVVAETDFVLTLGERVALAFAEQLPIRIMKPPVKLPTFDMALFWHERTNADPALAWLRDQIVASVPPSSP